jgi:ATP-binding cassette subfamily B protein
MVDIRQARQSELRRRIGMVTQDVQLFQASVRHNLTLFDESVPEARISQVVKDVGLGDWLASLPQGLETVLEAGGSGLSAGQAQLLAFARVLLADPGLVILDEASSRLDKATEAHIEKAVDRLLQDRTGIIVAHRLSTVQRADEIMILEDGHIAEYGPRGELAQDADSLFYSLLQTGLEEAMA